MEKTTEERLNELEWAEEVITNPDDHTEEERQEAEQLLSQSADSWDKAVDELDDILDIEDDDEREKAFEAWESAQG